MHDSSLTTVVQSADPIRLVSRVIGSSELKDRDSAQVEEATSQHLSSSNNTVEVQVFKTSGHT